MATRVPSTREPPRAASARFAPGSAGLALTGKTAEKLLPFASGVLVLALYAALIAAAGWFATLRREIA